MQALYDGGKYSLQPRRQRSASDGGEPVAVKVQLPAGHTARSSQGPTRADRSTRKSTPTVHADHSDQAGCGSRHGPPCRHSMMEASTHCNDAGNVAFATLVSLLLLRCSCLQGTPPGAVRDRPAPTAARASRRPLCTRTTQISLVLHQARPAVQALYDGGKYSLQPRRQRSASDGGEPVAVEAQHPAGHTARSSQGPSRADRRPLCTRTTQMRGVHQQARSDGTK